MTLGRILFYYAVLATLVSYFFTGYLSGVSLP